MQVPPAAGAATCALAARPPAKEAAENATASRRLRSSNLWRFILALPPALRGDGLPIKAQLVAPVLAVKRPNHVLLVGLDDVGSSLHHGDLRVGDRLVELVALSGRDVDENFRAV